MDYEESIDEIIKIIRICCINNEKIVKQFEKDSTFYLGKRILGDNHELNLDRELLLALKLKIVFKKII